MQEKKVMNRCLFAGCQEAELVDDQMGITFPMIVMYPTSTPEKTERLGPYYLAISKNAAPQEGAFPLILISHGTGGSPLVYRTLARNLARNGFIVGMPEHPFKNRNNNTMEGTVENLTHRPRHIRMAADWFFNSKDFAGVLKPDAVSLIGHSMGGYTALATAGGVPTSFPYESADGQSHLIQVTPDPRINIPILMLVGEKDQYTPSFHAQIILNGIPDHEKVQHRIVENAGHFSFLSPFPEAMTNASFPPSQDPLGFDRESFQHELNAEITDFLLRNTSLRGCSENVHWRR
ncbi:alpha/beta hydrolase family protein [Paenibacillus apiarius]|uniref:Dienelactone hydrolase family protein n=1 Tax=Paenibacillus apiarius TaxID=46240 RepID=A0ABT4DVF4_9BACL|nr:dienelactone hydrolase family protein [Paenibacillus apiarius]MCY9514785.1 dienelactone hydrolase family protein [Paenibacillus apiarius]MCY9521335.1 dienelactone hydrolase family protein [Paenibacillus apiarius]MCY9554051.1 dienelactone hydrolase family protein [Paenibacillus apiarius]MCY9560425.1 dienelactone hydrolase family protein [Paenibacillus apiarius]MCY9682238.1 dienelactone hydrolase family protein [Paenibacillus apiarius]